MMVAPEPPEREESAAPLLAELQGLKLRQLQAKATELDVDEQMLENAEGKSQIIALIVEKMEERAAAAETARFSVLKQELEGMKLRALQNKAVAMGVDEAELDDAEERSEVIDLILALAATRARDRNVCSAGWAARMRVGRRALRIDMKRDARGVAGEEGAWGEEEKRPPTRLVRAQ